MRSHIETESFEVANHARRLIDRIDPEVGHRTVNRNSGRLDLEPSPPAADDRVVGSRLGDAAIFPAGIVNSAISHSTREKK
jgi:hypothetical protein